MPPGGRRRRRAAALACAAALLLAPVPAGARKKEPPFTIVPAVGEPTGIAPGAEEIRVHREGLNATVSYVDGATRRKMMAATLGIDADPFATPSGQPVRFRTFLVYLENTSDHDLHFNPQVARVLTDREEFAYALDYSAVYMMLQRALSLDQIGRIIYDKPFLLEPRGRTRKLLVFEEIPGEKWQEFSLILTLDREGLVQHDLPARFRKLYLGESP
jgi:hypothetical protein